MINYSDDPLLKIKEVTPLFYRLYSLSVFTTYFGFIIISWYFINLAYTINTPSYDITCVHCSLFTQLSNLIFFLAWLFFLYFYILNEIRFRFAHYSGKKQEKLIKRNNSIYAISSAILVIITLFIII